VKTQLNHLFTALALLALSTLNSQFSSAHAQGTAFMYQGRLNDGTNPADGSYDLTFSLFNASTGGSSLAGPVTNTAVAVSNGLLTTMVDFGARVFTGGSNWLNIGVRSNGGGAFTSLTPRQQLTPMPYAIFAEGANAAGLTGNIPSGDLSGTYGNPLTLNNAGNTIAGNGSGLTGLNASQLTSGTVPPAALGNAWKIGGNAGTTPGVNFVGTTDNQPLELWVNGARAFRLEPNASGPNVIGGAANNSVATYGATIGGGWGNLIQNNAVFSTIAGGQSNQVQGLASGYGAHLGFIGGGQNNVIEPFGYNAAILGGYANRIQYDGDATVIAGGDSNLIGTNADYAAIGGGLGNLIATARTGGVVGGGMSNSVSSRFAAVAGGQNNSAGDGATGTGSYASVGGGLANQALGSYSTIGGGHANFIWSDVSWSELGFYTNSVFGTISGGESNQVSGGYGTVAGGVDNWAGRQDFVGGGAHNLSGWDGYVSTAWTTIGGGTANYVMGAGATIGGGMTNRVVGGIYATVGGGIRNEADGAGAFIGGGGYDGSTVLGNVASGAGSVIAGGTQNIASGSRSTAAGGHNNSATNWYATVPGGAWNIAGGMGSFAAGQAAKALHDGAFVWGDGSVSSGDITSTANNQFTARSAGGVRFFSNAGATVGVQLAPGANAWNVASDRNLKDNFALVDCRAVLEKVAALPITTWNLKSQPADIHHIGPMAQDFAASFAVGEDDRHISTSDADGVALAAIQGLNQKVEEKEARIREQAAEIEALKQNLAELKKLVQTIAETK
jgi:hypothetical protein